MTRNRIALHGCWAWQWRYFLVDKLLGLLLALYYQQAIELSPLVRNLWDINDAFIHLWVASAVKIRYLRFKGMLILRRISKQQIGQKRWRPFGGQSLSQQSQRTASEDSSKQAGPQSRYAGIHSAERISNGGSKCAIALLKEILGVTHSPFSAVWNNLPAWM